MMQGDTISVPLSVPKNKRKVYQCNYEKVLRGTKYFFLFAGDQKIEHLNEDFTEGPAHLFRIASQAPIGAFATHLGLITRYAESFPDVPYLVKLNGKTNLVEKEQKDPVSRAFNTVDDVVCVQKQAGLSIVGVGYTVYLGSEYETDMLREAAQIVYQAHSHGLLAVLWMYPRGKAIANDRDGELIAGAAGVGASLGADFVKVNVPEEVSMLKEVVIAAGNTGVLCAGGAKRDESSVLRDLETQIESYGVAGCAIGRNVHQKGEAEAIAFCERVFDVFSSNS